MLGTRTWILVCDACRARVFLDCDQRELMELRDFADVAAREHVRDRVSDRAGLKPGGGSEFRAGASPDTDPREAEAHRFAGYLAGVLKTGLNEHAYDELVLTAPPHFLGLLRAALDDQVARRVVVSIDKDFTTLDARELDERIHAMKR